jgi:hypothetical protein
MPTKIHLIGAEAPVKDYDHVTATLIGPTHPGSSLTPWGQPQSRAGPQIQHRLHRGHRRGADGACGRRSVDRFCAVRA